MERIKLRVLGSQIEVAERPAAITAGTVGLAVEFTFDSQWEGLAKTAVFRAGDKVIATTLERDTHTVPWEVLEKPDLWLSIGVYGANAEGTVVIPTLWAKVAVVHTGVDPEGDPALEPSVPIWQEVLTQVNNIAPAVSDHINNVGGDNPHGVTCEQIGAATKEEAQSPVFVTLVSFDEEIGEYVSSKSFEEIAEAYESNKIIYALHGNVVYNFADIREGYYATFVSVAPTTYDEPHPVKVFELGEYINDSGEPYTKVDFVLYDDIALATTFYVDEKIYGVTCEQIGAATKEEVEAAIAEKAPLYVTVTSNVPSSTNAEIYEAISNGREVYLNLWSGTYVKCTYATSGYCWFEGSYIASETIDDKAYSVVKYRLFVIENDKFKQSTMNLPKVNYIVDLEKRVAALEAQLNN